jgi:hypothetical protein
MRYKPGINTQTYYNTDSNICHRLHGSLRCYAGLIKVLANGLCNSIRLLHSPMYSLGLRVYLCLLIYIHRDGVYKEFLSSFRTISFEVIF